MSDNQSWWKTTWPLHKRHWKQLLIALLLVVAVSVVIGETLTNFAAPNAITEVDEELAQDFVEARTPVRNDVVHWAGFLADTFPKIGMSVAIAGFLLYRFRRWFEAVFIGLTLLFEGAAYTITTYIVQRPRPDVERLVESPVDTSFPSGHVAAATVYAAIAVLVFWHTRSVLARVVAAAVVTIIPIAVAIARIYQGMHFFSDVLAGIILGAVSVLICMQVMGRPPEADRGVGGSNIEQREARV